MYQTWRLRRIPGSPADIIHVEEGEDDQQQIHGRHGNVIDDPIAEAGPLEGMQ